MFIDFSNMAGVGMPASDVTMFGGDHEFYILRAGQTRGAHCMFDRSHESEVLQDRYGFLRLCIIND